MSFLRRLFGSGAAGRPAAPVPAARGAARTDAGMFALWDGAAFAHVVDYDTWEAALGEEAEVRRHVEAGTLVPIRFGADGSYEFEVRVGAAGAPAALSERERRYLTVSSEPYLLRTEGKAFVGGIEHVCGEPGAHALALALAPGEHAVTVHMVEWDAEPGAADASDSPAAHALPDFVLLLDPAEPGRAYRRSVHTFPPPPD